MVDQLAERQKTTCSVALTSSVCFQRRGLTLIMGFQKFENIPLSLSLSHVRWGLQYCKQGAN